MLFIKLLLAHLVSDFLINTPARRMSIEKHKIGSAFLYIHSLLYGLLAWLLVGDPHFWPLALMLSASHWIIETTRVYVTSNDTYGRWFWTSQLLQILILFGVWAYSSKISIQHIPSVSDSFYILATAAVLLSWPASAMIKSLISGLSLDIGNPSTTNSLANAGLWIGILERWLVFIFLIHGHWEPIGFLIAAKSVFRFGDLRDGHDRSLTEYVLIGTLLSFGMAIVITLFAKYLIKIG